jgi:hypothetical protein
MKWRIKYTKLSLFRLRITSLIKRFNLEERSRWLTHHCVSRLKGLLIAMDLNMWQNTINETHKSSLLLFVYYYLIVNTPSLSCIVSHTFTHYHN